ncbi:hypothetical protein BP5796_12717 [Coleophoma crateriformis]|uniref:Heterokaryon incompatibility domain-containing protein n=1 Tax=Coleophoma crateriformis TaxID=565419 RepID=A0A3D8Q6F6_9HELO|nr:hypothetical protein BP5796_12717 [Coleophoma crateriformis]
MPQSTGPRLWYPCETVMACIEDGDKFSLRNRFSMLNDEFERSWQLKEFFTPFLLAVQLPNTHFSKLDTHLSTLIPGALETYPNAIPSSGAQSGTEEVRVVEDIISRLPSLPQRLFALPLVKSELMRGNGTLWDGIRNGRWASKFVVPESRHHLEAQQPAEATSIMDLISKSQDIIWANLYVTQFIDTNSVVLATKIAQQGTKADIVFAQDCLQYINLLADLNDEFDKLDNAASLSIMEPFSDPTLSVQGLKRALFPEVDDGHTQGRAILKVFLWTVWQRSVMLYFYYIIRVQLFHGYPPEWSSLFVVQGIERLSHLDSEDYRGDGIDYVCNWAFEVLRTSRSSLGLDFRTMLSRFDSHFVGFSGRCIKGSTLTCQGDLPESCERFTGAETKAQSAHTTSCNGSCQKISWSEESYRKVRGPRAIDFEKASCSLQYIEASSRTMAISHVWSHGQGGRPEQGINLCLHEQYSSLAKSCRCDSYWIDSTCIPSDSQLRKEAIDTINGVFTTSNVILICDKDLQSVDISSEQTERPHIELLEILLSILLVCDWNVRAWTMLEAIRGRKNVHILTGGYQLISLTELFLEVLNDGAIDLAVLLGSAQHLLPSSDPSPSLSLEDGGFLLSQRHASRADDEIVIWGLLKSLPGDKSPASLWKSQSAVLTGYLMSSAPRIELPGYHWAPQTPYIRPQFRSVFLDDGLQGNSLEQKYMVCYQPYDGQGSYIAQNCPSGLVGKWLVCDLNLTMLAKYRYDFCHKTLLEVGHPTQIELNPTLDPMIEVYEQPDTASACNLIEELISLQNKVRIIRPLATCGTVQYEGGQGRGERYGTVAAICTLGAEQHSWKWQGVYQWLDETDDSTWIIETMVIV